MYEPKAAYISNVQVREVELPVRYASLQLLYFSQLL
jgi:hypothetical protein